MEWNVPEGRLELDVRAPSCSTPCSPAVLCHITLTTFLWHKKKIPCLDTVESLGNKYTVLILLQMVIDSTSTQKHWLILKRSVVLSFKKYSFNTQLCTGALGRTNWRRIVLPQSLSVHTNGISHSRQNKCYDVAVEKMPMHNQWAPRNEDCTR